MKDGTIIKIRKETAKQIKKRAITSRESYDEIIQRLLKNDHL